MATSQKIQETLTINLSPDRYLLDNPFQDKKDEELVEQIKTNKELFIYLMKRYEEKIKKYIRRISGLPPEAVEDLSQNIFLKVYLNLDYFDQSQKFSSWIYRIAHNETINFWLYNKRRQVEPWDINEAPKNVLRDSTNIENEIYQKINNQKLLDAFEVIDQKYSAVLVLNFIEGKSYREIAKEMDKPIATIGTLLNRGKKILKKELVRIGFTPDTAFQY